jgi:hypothetical protein
MVEERSFDIEDLEIDIFQQLRPCLPGWQHGYSWEL